MGDLVKVTGHPVRGHQQSDLGDWAANPAPSLPAPQEKPKGFSCSRAFPSCPCLPHGRRSRCNRRIRDSSSRLRPNLVALPRLLALVRPSAPYTVDSTKNHGSGNNLGVPPPRHSTARHTRTKLSTGQYNTHLRLTRS